jgi:hypothetical protein
MLKALTFLLLINDASGQTIAGRIEGLDFATCDAMQRAVWAVGYPTVAVDELGPIPAVDAACVEG